MMKETLYDCTPGTIIRIVSWLGCELKFRLDAEGAVRYDHQKIYRVSEYRINNEETIKRGPIVMTVTPMHLDPRAFYTHLHRALTRHTADSLMVIDLDVAVSIYESPGNIKTTILSGPYDPNYLNSETLLSLHYGHTSLRTNRKLYKFLVSKLAEASLHELEIEGNHQFCGAIVNTSPWSLGDGIEYLIDAAEKFKVDQIVVLHSINIFDDIRSQVPDSVEVKTSGIFVKNIFDLFLLVFV